MKSKLEKCKSIITECKSIAEKKARESEDDSNEMMVLEKENDYESVKFCPNCGRRDLLLKKLKCEEME